MERSRRDFDKLQEMAQQVEEISPSGIKRIVSQQMAPDGGGQESASPPKVQDPMQGESMEQSSGRAMNPFIDDQQEIDS